MKKYIISFNLFLVLFFCFLFQPGGVRADSKVLELLFNEGSGTTLQDSSGLGNNANINGANWIHLPTGKWVLNFNGSGNSASCSYTSSLGMSGTNAKVTLEVWVDMTQNKSSMWVGTGSGGSGGGYALYYNQPAGKAMGYIEGIGAAGSSTYGWKAAADTTPLGINHWYHVVYTYDGSLSRAYLDGVLISQSEVWAGGIFMSTYRQPFGVYSTFAGMFGKISVYDYALSSEQINNIYLSERASYYQLPTSPTIYVFPAITDNKILPSTIISSQYISNSISISGSPGEYKPASFVVYASDNISSMTATVSDLTGSKGIINSDSVDIRVVKSWYQSGEDIYTKNKKKLLTPELLLKDDSLIKIENQENYLKLTSGDYTWISEVKNLTSSTINTIAGMPVQDSSVLLPLNIPAKTNKQFWITIKIPEAAAAGTYNGTIQLSSPLGGIGSLQLALTVLPIKLSDSYLDYSIYYRGQLSNSWPQGSISSEWKSEVQMEAELKNMFDHGVTNPTVYQGFSTVLLGKVMTMRNNVGMGSKPLYYLGVSSGGSQPSSQVTQTMSIAAGYGVTDVYFYGTDEAKGDALTAQRTSWQGIKSAGGKMFVSGYTAEAAFPGNFALVGDILDLFVCASAPSSTEAAKWHSVNHKILNYANPQVGEEKPETYRRNYGLLLWQNNYDGAMDYAYQHSFGSIWNDYDHGYYRDHNFTYPTINGVIDTIQWEGFREGVNDVRYLTTLQDTIKKSKALGINTSAADTWLVSLKSLNLATNNLDTIRSEMINHILTLQNQAASCTSCNLGTPIINPTSPVANQSFAVTCPVNASGYDCIDAYANGNSNKCTLSSYSGNNIIFNCSGMASGSYIARCVSRTETSRNCCASEKTASYTIKVALDTTLPSQITNFSTSNITQNAITLNWTAPGDDGSNGTATSYDVRYSTTAITSSNWATVTQATGEPTPSASGTSQTFSISGLTANTTYYFAIRATDDAGNISTLSNIPSGKTSTITVPTITLTSPNGGETWQRGTTHNVTWTYSNVTDSNVKITLLKNGVNSGTIIASTPIGTNGTGSYAWPIAAEVTNVGSTFSVKVEGVSQSTISDVGDAYFTLTLVLTDTTLPFTDTAPPSQVISPSSGGSSVYSSPISSSGPTSAIPAIIPETFSAATPSTEQLKAIINELLARNIQQSKTPVQKVSSQFKFEKPLYLGLKNEDVKQLQIFLSNQGAAIYPEAKVTGYYGLLTKKAIIKFQLKYNIISSEYSPGAGLTGIKTRARINEILVEWGD